MMRIHRCSLFSLLVDIPVIPLLLLLLFCGDFALNGTTITTCQAFPSVSQLHSSRHRYNKLNICYTTKDATIVDKSDSSSVQQQLSLPPGRTTRRFWNVFFDDTLRLLHPKTMASYQVTRKQQYGPIFKTNIFFTPTVFVTDDETFQELGNQEALTIPMTGMRAFFPPHHQKLFGTHSVLVTSGPSHDRVRKLMTSSLSPTIVNTSYSSVIHDSVEQFFANLQSDDDRPMAMVPKVRSFFIRLMLQVVLGTNDDEMQEEDLAHDIEIWSRGLLAAPLTFIPWSTASKALRARQRIVTKLRDIMKQEETKQGTGLLAKLMATTGGEEDDRLSDDEIIDNILTLLFAGSDTTASVTISLWKVLSEHPNLKLDLQNATDEQVDSFVRLVMQTYPPAPFSMRRNMQDIQVGGYRIPANWLVVYGIAGVLLSRPQPNNPWKVPEIESSTDVSKSTSTGSSVRASWVPFGTGPRQCPGRFLANLELKIIARKLATLQWELESDQDLSQRYTPGFFPVDGFKVKFIPSAS